MKKLLAVAVALTAGALCLWAPGVLRSSDQGEEAPKTVPAKGDDVKARDEKALLESLAAYRETFNRGDADALAKLYTDDAELVDPSSDVVRGSDAIRKEFADIFKRAPGVQIDLAVDSLRWLSGDVIVQHGSAKMTPKGEPASFSTYSSVHVKQNGQWKISMVREAPAGQEASTPEEHLAPLTWLIGEWRDADEEGAIHLNCSWTKHKAFLMRSFTVASAGDDNVIHGTEVIGWDPIKQAPKSFIFDSRGCMGEGHWLHKLDRWYCKVSTVLPDGKKVSALHVFKPVDADHYTFQSVSRTIDGHTQPDTAVVTVMRIPATEKK